MDSKIGAYTFRTTQNPDGTWRSEPIPESTKDPVTNMAEYPSKSFPGITHKVFYSKPTGFFCTCTGFVVHRHCWHVLDVMEKIKERMGE